MTNILEKIKLNLLANDVVDKKDKACFMSKDQNILNRCEKFANFMGRRVIIGNLAGAARVIYGIAKTALSLTAHTLLFLTGLATFALLPGRDKIYLPIFRFGSRIGEETTDGILHVSRGVVEMIPFVGIPILIKIDANKSA